MEAKKKIAGLMMFVMALSSPLVYADSGGPDSSHQPGGWHHEDHKIDLILNLSADQQKQLKDSWQKQKDAMKSIFEQMKTNREAFDAEITKATPDMNKINDLQGQLKTIQSQMADNHLSSIMEIKKIMTPEQFAGYMALEKEKRLKMHEGHGKFDHKDAACAMGDGHKHGGDKEDMDQPSDD